MNLDEVYVDPADLLPAPPRRGGDTQEFFRERKKAIDELRSKGLLHQGSPALISLMPLPHYVAYSTTANVYMRTKKVQHGKTVQWFIAIPEPIYPEGREIVKKFLEQDLSARKDADDGLKDDCPWFPYQARNPDPAKKETHVSHSVYATPWCFRKPIASLVELFKSRERSASFPQRLCRKLEQIENGEYIHIKVKIASDPNAKAKT